MRNPLHVSYSCLKEDRFEIVGTGSRFEGKNREKEPIKILFRGKYNREAGIEFIESAFKNSTQFKLTIACPDLPSDHIRVSGINYEEGRLSERSLRDLFLKHDLGLGQFGDCKRIEWTIPHKIFEYAYLGIPTICAESTAVNEIFSEAQFYFAKRISLRELLDDLAKDERSAREVILLKSQSVINQYKQVCSERAIAIQFLNILKNSKFSHIPSHEQSDISQQ